MNSQTCSHASIRSEMRSIRYDERLIFYIFSLTIYKVIHSYIQIILYSYDYLWVGGGPRVVVTTAAFHARVRGLGGLKETKMFLPHPLVKTQFCGEPP